jgi:hypothetical protein
MTLQHSPGPWRSEICMDFQTIVDANNKTLAAVFASESLPLLLAAPDLLEAVELMVSQYGCACGQRGCNRCEYSRIAREAIQKARGEQ